MQTLIMSIALIAIAIVVYRQHLGLKKLYQKSQAQDTINYAFSAEICQLKAQQKKAEPKVAASLPPFIPQKGGDWYARI